MVSNLCFNLFTLMLYFSGQSFTVGGTGGRELRRIGGGRGTGGGREKGGKGEI